MDKAIWPVKNKVFPAHTMKANGREDGAAWSATSNMPQTFSLVPTTPQVGGAPEQVQTFGSLVTIPIKLSCQRQAINEQTRRIKVM